MRRDAQENFDRIIDAARALMHAKEDHFTMEDVATQADVGVGTIYRKFPTKKCLIEALLIEQITQTLQQFDAAAAQDDPWQGFADMMLCAGELFAEFGKLAATNYQEHAQYYEHRAIVHQKINIILSRAQAAGVVRSDLTVSDVCCMFVMLSCPVISHDLLVNTGRRRMVDVALAGCRPTPYSLSEPTVDPAHFSQAFQEVAQTLSHS